MNRAERRRQARSSHREVHGDVGIDLPTVATDPGCDDEGHAPEVMAAAMSWYVGDLFELPAFMACGCRILWIGDGMPPESVMP